MIPLPTVEGGYRAILADPAWTWKSYSDKGLTKSPQSHYECMTLEDIKALPVADIAAKDSALFMWATWPMLPEALETMKAWGYIYKSGGPWAKQSKSGTKWAFGTGYIFRSASEVLLVGTRGKPTFRSKSERNLWVAPVREHSRKPEQVRHMVERHIEGAKLEMFAREGASGWDSWGNQTELFSSS